MLKKKFLESSVGYKIYLILRMIRCFFVCRLYGLKSVSVRSHIAYPNSISKDFRMRDYSYVGPHCSIAPGVEVGEFTMLAERVLIVGKDHVTSVIGVPIIFAPRPEFATTTISSDVWIGARSTIIAGVNIGRGSIVAAGSVVTKDVPAYAVVAGVPARFVKMRFTPEEVIEHERSLLARELAKWRYCGPVGQ